MPGALVSREILDVIRRVVLEEAGKLGVDVDRIILFGSRARGGAREDSDWDIMVVVKGDIHWRVRSRFYGRVHRRLVEALGEPVDLLVVPYSWFRERISDKLTLEAEVAETGVEIPV